MNISFTDGAEFKFYPIPMLFKFNIGNDYLIFGIQINALSLEKKIFQNFIH